MRALRIFTLLLGTTTMLTVGVAAPAQSDQNWFDTNRLALRYEGRTVDHAELQQLQSTGRALHVAYDVASARKGIAHAFDTAQETEAWHAANYRPSARPGRSLIGIESAEAACSEPTSGSRLYNWHDCGDNFLAVLPTKNMPQLSSFGAGGSATWNDRASSIVMDGTTACALRVTLYQHGDYNAGRTGWVRWYYGESWVTAYNMEYGVSNEGSSLKSICA